MGNAKEKITEFLNKFWPLIFITFLWFVFASPFFLKGKIPFAGDYQVTFFAPWSQYSQFAMPVKNNAMPDVIDQLYPWKHLVISDWKNGEIPLWNPYQFGGTPLLANYQSAAFSPMNILFFIFPFKIGWALLVLLQPLLAAFGMYFFVKKLSVSRIGSTFSSIAFMFCSFLVTWMGYATLGYAIAVLPLVLLGLEGFVQSRKYRYLCLTTLSIAFSFLSGHFQISLYVLFAAFLYFLFRFVSNTNKALFLSGLLSLISGVLLASVQIFPSIAVYASSLRSTLFERPEIIPWQYFITLVSPDFLGNPVTRNDWFGHYAEWGSYLGVFPLLFALFSLKEMKKNIFVIFFTALGMLSLLLATPSAIGDSILKLHIPVISTSAAGRIIVLLSFSLSVLAGFGLDSWVKSLPKIKMFLGIVGFILLCIGWFVILFKVGLTPDHVQIAKSNFLLPSIFLLIAIGISVFTYFFKNKKLILIICFILLFLTGFDMYRFASKWQTFSPSNLVFPDIRITDFFKTIKDNRSFGNYGGQVSLFYQLPAIEGYDALYPERIGELASFVANGKVQPASRSVVDFPKNGKYTKPAIDLLGVRYVIHKVSDANKSWAFPVWQYPNDYSIVYKDSQYIVFKSHSALPRAYVVGNYSVQSDNQQNLTKLFSQTTNRTKTITLEEDPGIKKTDSLVASATIISYLSNKVAIQTVSNARALLFLSDTYFPGWKAYIDGKETKIYRADFAFRAISIPSGKHTVIFSYWPESFTFGLGGSALGVILLGFLYFFQKRRV